jgi:hypothetical protein
MSKLNKTKDSTELELCVWWVQDDGTKEALTIAGRGAAQLAAYKKVADAVRRNMRTISENYPLLTAALAELDETQKARKE